MNLKKLISILLLSSLILPSIATAQESISPEVDPFFTKGFTKSLPSTKLLPGEKDPGNAISPMKRGQRAPFSGVLFSPSAVATTIVEFESFEERLHIEIMKSVAEERAAGDKRLSDANAIAVADKKVLQSNFDAAKREATAFKIELKDLKDSQPNPYLWAGLGGAGGIVFTLLTVFAVTQITK